MGKQNDKVFVSGVYSEGYGMIAKKAMRDRNLTIEAKAIYAYLVSFSGAGLSSFPSTELILKDLGISNHRYLRHRKLLEEYGYIEITQERSENGFGRNVYRIVTDQDLYGRFVHTRNVHTQNVHTRNDHTISNSNISNSNISNTNNSGATEVDDELKIHKEVIGYINELSGREFKHDAGSNIKLVNGRLNDNHSPDIIKEVMRYKWNEWKDTQMEKYFRPSTLLRKSNFDKYLEEYKFHEDQNKEEKEFDNMFGDVL